MEMYIAILVMCCLDSNSCWEIAYYVRRYMMNLIVIKVIVT